MEKPIWYTNENGHRARLIIGSQVIAIVERLGPNEWAYDVLDIPNAAGRENSRLEATRKAYDAWLASHHTAARLRGIIE